MNRDLMLWSPGNLTEATQLANQVAESAFAPADFKGKPQDCLMAMMYGNEIGLRPMMALQSIAVIKGRPCVWGDAAIALVQQHPDFEDIIEEWDAAKKSATCTIKRKGRTPVVRMFSMDNAKDAKLDQRETYKQYPARMCQMRARSYAMRDLFPEVFKGMGIREEVEDYPTEPRDVTEPPKDPVREIRDELQTVLDEGVEAGAVKQTDADTVIENSKKYGTVTTLRKFVDKVKESVAKSIAELPAEEPEQHVEDIPSDDLDAVADEVFEAAAEGTEYDPTSENQEEFDIF